MLRSLSRLFTLLALAISTLSFAGHAAAQARPFVEAGVAQFAANLSDFTGSGQAAHLGAYTEVGNVTLAPTSTPGLFTVDGWTHYTAANGDVLFAEVSGTLDMVTGAIVGTATYVGGTGRFANASGGSILAGQMIGGGALTITAIGSIDY